MKWNITSRVGLVIGMLVVTVGVGSALTFHGSPVKAVVPDSSISASSAQDTNSTATGVQGDTISKTPAPSVASKAAPKLSSTSASTANTQTLAAETTPTPTPEPTELPIPQACDYQTAQAYLDAIADYEAQGGSAVLARAARSRACTTWTHE
jgi:hypothetical protein